MKRGRQLTLVILAAGLGRRFGGPKQIESVGPSGEILLDYSAFDALRAGFSRLVFVIREDVKGTLERRLGPLSGRCEIEYVEQRLDDVPAGYAVPTERRRPWGTGHAVWACRDAVTEPFAVVNADDFYGASAFDAMAQFLCDVDGRTPLRAALVGYALGATLTPHGAVSRGVCEVDELGRLVAIVERHGVERREAGIGYSDRGTWHPLDAAAVASMNFWGFAPSVFPAFGRGLVHFLELTPAADDEFGLPTAVASFLKAREGEVHVLPTKEAWLGVTHREDLEWARDEIRRRVQAGVYPSPIWGRP
ncbi:MAG: NTP transferase domain-containing protein [Candidatus Bipolaricaulota bacterium]|nr:NTP transferase domain-containing protein [Candidatus Bipolaricaulota bacterium]